MAYLGKKAPGKPYFFAAGIIFKEAIGTAQFYAI